MTKQMLNVRDIMELLGVRESKSYKIIKQLNEELDAKGYITIQGKVPIEYFKTKFYGIKVDA